MEKMNPQVNDLTILESEEIISFLQGFINLEKTKRSLNKIMFKGRGLK